MCELNKLVLRHHEPIKTYIHPVTNDRLQYNSGNILFAIIQNSLDLVLIGFRHTI